MGPKKTSSKKKKKERGNWREHKSISFSLQTKRIEKAENTKAMEWNSPIAESPSGVSKSLPYRRRSARAKVPRKLLLPPIHRGVTNDEEDWKQGWRRRRKPNKLKKMQHMGPKKTLRNKKKGLFD